MLSSLRNNQIEKIAEVSPHRGSVTPLLIGTFILRVNGAAASIILGRFLAQLASEHGHSISNIHVGLIAVAYYAIELSLAPFMGDRKSVV